MALARRLPLAIWSRETFEAGALMTFGADQVAMCRAPVLVDKILKVAKPADLPMEPSTKLELLVNRKVAGVLGLTIPPSLLARAEQVVQ